MAAPASVWPRGHPALRRDEEICGRVAERVGQDMYKAQLRHFVALAPSGFIPFEGRRKLGSPLVVELEYRHTDGRTHILEMNQLTSVVYDSRTVEHAKAPQLARV